MRKCSDCEKLKPIDEGELWLAHGDDETHFTCNDCSWKENQ